MRVGEGKVAVNVEGIIARKGSDVYTIAPGATLAEAVRVLRERGIGALVVSVNGSRLDGILSERDVVRRLASDGGDALDMTVARAMTNPVVTCGLHDELGDLMSVMTDRRVRHLPVVNDGGLCGLVSIGDVVKHRLVELEVENQALFDYIAHTR
jgi:CBS domain-containing protein